MYRLRTACGREVTLTGDHNLWVLRDGHLTLIETADARQTDYVPLPESLGAPLASEATSVDLVETMPDVGLYVHAQEQVEAFVGARGTAAFAEPFAASGAGNPYVKLFDVRSENAARGGIGTGAFRAVREATGDLAGAWSASGAMLAARAGAALPAEVPLTPSLLYFLGVYVAEGHATESYVTVSSRDEEICTAIEQAVGDLGLSWLTRPSGDYQVSSRVLAQWLRHLVGNGSASKCLPEFWASLSDADLGTLLRGYFDGDGTVERASAVTAVTASEALASGVAYALFRFGIWARLRRVFKRATNSDHAGAWYWQITVSGQDDLHRFAQHVGFGLTRKHERLAALLGARGNTNVDVVPIRGADLRSLRQRLQSLGARSRCAGGRDAKRCAELRNGDTAPLAPGSPRDGRRARRRGDAPQRHRASGGGDRHAPAPHLRALDARRGGGARGLRAPARLRLLGPRTGDVSGGPWRPLRPQHVLARQRHPEDGQADARLLAQQDAGCPALRRVQDLLPEQRHGVLHLLLRLLPARGLHRLLGHVHREGHGDQRGDRPAPPPRHIGARERTQGHRDRGVGELHLRVGQPAGVQKARHPGQARRDRRPRRVAAQACQRLLHPQRHRLCARHVPRAWRSGGGLPGLFRGSGLPHHLLG